MEKFSLVEIIKALELENIDTSKMDLETSLQSAKMIVKNKEKVNGNCKCFTREGTDIVITEHCKIHYEIFV